MVAERFTVGPGEKVLVVSGRYKDFESWFEKNPQIRDRVIFCSDDDSKNAIPENIKGILFGKFVSHTNAERLNALARKKGVHFTKFFPNSGQLKSFLEMSVLIDKEIAGEEVAEVLIEQEQAIQTKEEPEVARTKTRRGMVRDFVLANADFSARPKTEANRLFKLAAEQGLHTTPDTLENTFYILRRMERETQPQLEQPAEVATDHAPKKKRVGKQEDGAAIIAKYLESVKSFLKDSEIAAVAIAELVEKVQMMEVDRAGLLKEIDILKKENAKLRSEFKKKLADFAKNF